MKLSKEVQDWIKLNQAMLKGILKDRMNDYMNNVVDEEDPVKKQVLSLFVKELRMVERLVENISNQKEAKKPEEEFTGM